MSNTNESGHSKNVANYKDLINICTNFGEEYKPTQTIITLEDMNTTYINARTAVSNVNEYFRDYSEAVIDRHNIFRPLSKLCTRIINMLDASGADDETVENVRTIVNKIQGVSTSNRKPTDPDKETNEKVSQSQMSFDSRTGNFEKLVDYLKGIYVYNPNETELQVANLRSLCDRLMVITDKVSIAYDKLNTIRNRRNEILYSNLDCMVKRAQEAKKYVKAVFGNDNPNYKKISALYFKSIEPGN